MAFLPGDVVKTLYGVGVITSCPKHLVDVDPEAVAPSYRVLLWRIPGKSIGSSSVAYLQGNAILGRLPVAPGMTTTAKGDKTKRLMVTCYYSSRDTFLVAPLTMEGAGESEAPAAEAEEPTETPNSLQERLAKLSLSGSILSSRQMVQQDGQEILPAQLEPAPSSKFYPLLEELIRRGEQTAAATSGFLHKKEVTNVISKATTLVESSAQKAQQAKGKINVDELATSVKTVVPNDEEVKQLIGMLKDEELTVLLEKGRKRLQQLVSNDIPKATEAALQKTGIRVVNEEEDGIGSMKTIVESRQTALIALEDLLKQAEVDSTDLEAIRGNLEDNFTTMFDSLAQAAKSDRTLSSIFETVSDQTAEWQEATGRLMSTRSASLFLEGASRIQARAATIFSKDQLQWAGEIGSKFTKAFTEGDAAVARLKSIELGDKVRNRLVEAIEVRSESLGGLDGIIAGALTTIKGDGESGDQMSNMLTMLQGRASSVTKDGRETLISVLGRRSEYRDVALLKIERVMCDLESQLGEDLSPEDIAAIARGEGGTAKLFEPIAKRAAKEIEKQLDIAEASVTDPTIVDVLKHVRNIVSGELSLGAVLDEVVNVLNDDKIVAAGENLVKHGEQVLDAIEGVSGNKVVDDVMKIAEKAGITKDSLMKGVESLDVNELLDTAGNAMTDETARKVLLSDATDTALDFILRILPSMPIPPFDGVKDGLVYHISNLSMEGFKVKKENIMVEVAGMRATKRNKQRKGPKIEAVEESDTLKDDASVENKEAVEFTSGNSPARSRTSSNDSAGSDFLDVQSAAGKTGGVKATELLIIDVREVSALFNDAVWRFEQTYLPYLKGNGKFDVDMSDGAIRLAFELRRRPKDGVHPVLDEFDASQWEPVLCLHDRSCSIGSVELKMQGESRIAWVVNKAASMFKGVLRDYVVRTILSIITDRSGWILAKLNEGLAPFSDVVMRTAKLTMEDLQEAGLEDIMAAKSVEASNLIELVWRERIPLGMNLLLNDESGLLKVVDFPRGSQARTVCEKRNIDSEGFKGATIVAVNGIRYINEEDLFDALRDPNRPKTVQFELADTEDAERIRRFVEESQGGEISKKATEAVERKFESRTVEFKDEGELGIEFANAPDNFGLVIRKFIESEDGIVLAAERHKDIHEGDLLTHINGELVLGEDGSGRVRAMTLLAAIGTTRPLSLSFSSPYMFRGVFEKSESVITVVGGPSELVLEEKKADDSDTRRIVISGFKEVDGIAEHMGILIGDHLVFINGISVGAGCRWLGEDTAPSMEQVKEMLADKASYPIGLTFARPQQAEETSWASSFMSSPQTEFTLNSAETICVTADLFDQIGCMFDLRDIADVVVSDLEAVTGPFQSMMAEFQDRETGHLHLSIDSVNGQFVPGYATTQMVKSAMERSWKSENRVELLFCDDEKKKWVHSLKSNQ